MFRLNRITIHGFKDPNRVVDLAFAEGPITVIYGENGSGKTTLLKVLQAVLSVDGSQLRKENISSCTLKFQDKLGNILIQKLEISGKETKIKAKIDLNGQTTILPYQEYKEITESVSSILFGINRGGHDLRPQIMDFINQDLIQLKNHVLEEGVKTVDKLIRLTTKVGLNNDELINKNRHLSLDDLPVSTIEKALKTAYDKGHTAVLTGMSNAFFATIDNAINLNGAARLSHDFQSRFNKQKRFFLSFVENLDESVTKKRLKDVLNKENPELSQESSIFKALLNNLLIKAEQDERENLDLKAINRIVEIFNDFVIFNKKLIVNAVETYIELNDGQRHELKDLSSGERHLLSFLTLFLILGRDRNIFLIDEPEISMSIKWQRKLLGLLSEFSPQAQIIVATHSPSIADGHTEYLKELV